MGLPCIHSCFLFFLESTFYNLVCRPKMLSFSSSVVEMTENSNVSF
jgi:hypothetical protein